MSDIQRELLELLRRTPSRCYYNENPGLTVPYEEVKCFYFDPASFIKLVRKGDCDKTYCSAWDDYHRWHVTKISSKELHIQKACKNSDTYYEYNTKLEYN